MFWPILVSLLLAGPAHAATVELSGETDRTVEVWGGELYLDDGSFIVNVEQNQKGRNIGVIVRQSPAGATWNGARIIGWGVNRTEPWDAIYHRLPEPGNGACLIIQNSPRFVVERLRCDWTWDGFRDEGGGTDWTLRLSWLSNMRDDAIENDRCYNGKIDRTLVEDVFVGYSGRPGNKESPCKYKLEVTGSMISLGRHYDDLEKRTRPWTEFTDGKQMQSGALWKVSGTGEGTEILLKDTMIKHDHTPGVSTRELRLVPEGWKILPGSGNNTFVWLGKNDLPGLTYETVDGCKVPKEFKTTGAVGPDGKRLFKVMCGDAGRKAWADARVKLLAQIEPSAPVPPTDPVVEFLQELELRLQQRAADVKQTADDLQQQIEHLLKSLDEPDG